VLPDDFDGIGDVVCCIGCFDTCRDYFTLLLVVVGILEAGEGSTGVVVHNGTQS
jgi:hypothetical protein